MSVTTVLKVKLITILIIVLVSLGIYAVLRSGGNVSHPAKPAEAKILVVGDMMFDRTIRKAGEARGYDGLFSCVEDYLSGFDLVVGNLEGPITYGESLSLHTKPGDPYNTRFTFSPKIASALFRANIRAVNLGNNHISDFGREGIESTEKILGDAGVDSFGATGREKSEIIPVNGMKIAFVNFNQFLGETAEDTIKAIWRARRESDFVAVYAHWGDEYEQANAYQKSLAESFIEAGADAVFGSHPHVIQKRETYSGKEIFYSLGNFIFDQYFNEDVKKGEGIEMSVRDGKALYKEVYFDISPSGTCRLP